MRNERDAAALSAGCDHAAVLPIAVDAQRAVYIGFPIAPAGVALLFFVFSVLVPVPASEAPVAVRLEYVEFDGGAVSHADARLGKRRFAVRSPLSRALGGLGLSGEGGGGVHAVVSSA